MPTKILLTLAVALTATVCAHGATLTTSQSPNQTEPLTEFVSDLLGNSTSLDPNTLAEAQAGPTNPSEPTQTVLALPPGPTSIELVLCALTGFGVWHASRNARKLNLGTLPDWYHTGGPAQVGYATPLDLSFQLDTPPLGDLEVPPYSGSESPSLTWLTHDWTQLLRAQTLVRALVPRGPPLHS